MSNIEGIAVKHDDLKVFLSCDCSSVEHTIVVQVFDWGSEMPYGPDFIVNIQAVNYRPFYKRVWAALKYIFGADLIWNDVILQKDDIPKLQAAIDHYNKLLKNNEKKVVDKL
jgi:hypothetical protein